jgi:hypothetical protein
MERLAQLINHNQQQQQQQQQGRDLNAPHAY